MNKIIILTLLLFVISSYSQNYTHEYGLSHWYLAKAAVCT
jgi:hypothetical protein